MKNLLFICSLAAIFSCQETDENLITTDLKGTWQLVEVLADPGDGSGTYQPIDSDWTISFNSEGIFYSSTKLCNQNVDNPEEENGNYDEIEQQINVGSCSFTLAYKLENSELILLYPCIEACGHKFKKIANIQD